MVTEEFILDDGGYGVYGNYFVYDRIQNMSESESQSYRNALKNEDEEVYNQYLKWEKEYASLNDSE